MEEYDPVHPTMSTGSITPGQHSYPDSPHSRSSLGSEGPVPDIVEPEDTSIASKIQAVSSILNLPRHAVTVESAPEKVPKTYWCITSGGGFQ